MKKRSNKNVRTPGFTPTSNPEFAAAMRNLRASSATSRHMSTHQKRTRAAAKSQAIKDQF